MKVCFLFSADLFIVFVILFLAVTFETKGFRLRKTTFTFLSGSKVLHWNKPKLPVLQASWGACTPVRGASAVSDSPLLGAAPPCDVSCRAKGQAGAADLAGSDLQGGNTPGSGGTLRDGGGPEEDPDPEPAGPGVPG